MKRILHLIVLSILFFSPIFAFDPPQRNLSVIIDKELLNEIDKIYFIKDCSVDSQTVDINSEFYFSLFHPKTLIKIKLKNQQNQICSLWVNLETVTELTVIIN